MGASTFRKLARTASFRTFLQLDRVGIHVLPKHYYNPVSDYAWLAKNKALWARRTDLAGVAWDLDQQLLWLEQTCEPYYAEVQGLQLYTEIAASGWGQGYGPIESQVLHCFIRTHRPRRIVEVGSGVSTVCAVRAAAENLRETSIATEICAIEPFPRPALRAMREIRLVPKQVQEQELCFFDELGEGDLLFIDSSHAVKTGSDVLFLYLEVIPRLKPGVFLHIHDIDLPYIYPRNLLSHFHAWQETALLLALLKGNPRLKVLCCLSALHYDRRFEMSAILTDYSPQMDVEEGLAEPDPRGHFPSSIYLITGS
jgi:hypothetical protein